MTGGRTFPPSCHFRESSSAIVIGAPIIFGIFRKLEMLPALLTVAGVFAFFFAASPLVCIAQEAAADTPAVETPATETSPYSLATAETSPVSSTTPEASAPRKPKLVFHGFVSNKYILRTTGEDTDQDLYQHFDVEVGDRLRNRVTGHLFLRVSEDIDGHQGVNGFYAFDNIDDIFNNNYDLRIYYAYFDIHRIKYIELIRAGRQVMHETPVPLYFDGVRVESAPGKSPFRQKFGVFGGFPSYHLYDTNTDDDAIYGAFAQLRPWIGGKIKIGWIHIDEKKFYSALEDDLFSVDVWHNLGEHVNMHVTFTALDEKSRDLQLRTTYINAELDLLVQASYYDLLETQTFHTIAFDPYFAINNEYFPYREVNLSLYKGLGKHFAIDAGFTGRKLKDENREGPFNHEFLRYFLSLSAFDVFARGLEANLSGDVWDSYTLDSQLVTISAEAGYQLNKKLKASVGTDYALYKYDYNLVKELQNARTYYLKLKYKPVKRVAFTLDYQFEHDDFDEYHIIEAGAKYIF